MDRYEQKNQQKNPWAQPGQQQPRSPKQPQQGQQQKQGKSKQANKPSC